jgi:bifunctional UDP-N-acetylglucosamine pyrophosphorylase/glucosamine-1-phosphate N-acetyltransferase
MNTRVIVLAAGRGKRMKSETPKVLTLLNDRPLIQYLLDSILASKVDMKPVIVVGKNGDLIKNTLGTNYEYVLQSEPLGTAHAVLCAKNAISDSTEKIIVLYGDQPFVSASTIKELKESHEKDNANITIITTEVEDFNDWKAVFYEFGRIVRDENGKIQSIVEKKDASKEQLEIKEVNPAYYCFNPKWLWENLKKINNSNAAKEYYLTDLVKIAIKNGDKINSININPIETVGVNSKEHLDLINTLLKRGLYKHILDNNGEFT